jgi:hypothetical protein
VSSGVKESASPTDETRAVDNKMRAIAIQALAGNTGAGCVALDALCGTLSGIKAELFVAQSSICNIGPGGWEDFEVMLIHLTERVAALHDFAAACFTVEWKKQEGGAS